MSEQDAQRAAEWLASHALLLLGLGLVLAAVALAMVVAAVSAFRRHQDAIRAAASALLSRVTQVEFVGRWLGRSRRFTPSGYLALHLALGLAGTAAVVVFVVIAEEVAGRGEIVAFDLAFSQALRDASTPGWQRFFAAFTWFGSGWTIAVATAVVAVRLARTGQGLLAAGWAAAQAGGAILNAVLKETFERTRPAFAEPLLGASGWSFPSGHAMGTFIFVGLGSYLVLRDLRSWTATAVVITAALAWCVAIAFSRLYLGVHFASDVVAGMIAGAAWVSVCISALEAIRTRRGVRTGAGRSPVPPARPSIRES
jgi:undecaprenyl-diphosphatase